MLKNYFEIDENITINNFLKEIKEKKNSHYIILNTEPKTFVDIRTIALRVGHLNEKLKNLKKKISRSKKTTINEKLDFLIESGERVIQVDDEFYSFVEGLEDIKEINPESLQEKIENVSKKEIYALNENDKISSARNIFLKKRINILPVIDELKLIGELRPIDLLVTDLYNDEAERANFYTEKYKVNVLNLPITNLINRRPITINKEKKIKDVIDIMIKKKLPSLIVTEDEEKLYSVISYKDIFRLYQKEIKKPEYVIQYVGSDVLFDEDFDLIQDFVERSAKKIMNISKYNDLKVSFKLIGEKDSGHQNKIEVKLLLSEGNNVMQVEKEIITGTSDEEYNDRVKGRWNIPLLVQDALTVLEKKVRDEKSRYK